MAYIKKNLTLTKTLTQNNNIYKSFTICNLPNNYHKIPMQDKFNLNGLTYINIKYIK